MRYHKEFEQYWKRAQHNLNFNGMEIRGLDTTIKRIAYNAWKKGRQIKEYELDMARSNGAFQYLLNEDFQQKVDTAMQEIRRTYMDAYYDRWKEIFDKTWREGTKVVYSESS